MLLSDTAVRQAKPQQKQYSLCDGRGLSLQVPACGSKRWDFRFQWHGRTQRLALGTYPEIALKDARALREEARSLVARGLDPRLHLSAKQHEDPEMGASFGAVFVRWYAHKAKRLTNARQGTLAQIDRIFKKDLIPSLGNLLVPQVRRIDLVTVIRRIEKRNALSTAEKCRGWLREMFRFAIAEGLLDQNPASDLGILAEPQPPVRHHPFLRLADLPDFMIKMMTFPGTLQIELALRLLLLTGVRTIELRMAMPEQFDLGNALWTIPASGVKQLQRAVRTHNNEVPPYLVPLSRQAVEIVRQLIRMKLKRQRYLLRGRDDQQKSISEATLNAALHRMGYKGLLTGHGLRATLSTALNELNYEPRWIEAQLSHADHNLVRGSYNHAEYVPQRRDMMQAWADLLEGYQQPRPEAGLLQP